MTGFKPFTAQELYSSGVGASAKEVEAIAQHLGINSNSINASQQDAIKGFIAKAKQEGKPVSRLIAESSPQSAPDQQSSPGRQAESASSVVHAAIGPSLVYTQQFATGYDECLGNLEEQLTDFMVQRAGAVLPNSISRFHERLPEAGISGGEAISTSPFQFPSFNPPAVQRASLPSVPGNVSAAKQLPSATS